MIYTITLNPSLDYITRVEDFKLGVINRTVYEEFLPGGKGINVSIVLKNLGLESVAMGYVAGFTGREICKRVEEYGCETDFIMVENGMTRINMKLKSREETEINGQGPHINNNNLNQLFDKINRIQNGDVIVLAGSIPSSIPDDIYEKILNYLEGKKIHVVVDTTRNLLVNVLKYHPFLIKPNNHELGEIFDTEIRTKKDVVFYGKKLQNKGARNVLVSMASEGAVLITEDGAIYDMEAPKGTVVNSVGAGDSMVAGFIFGYMTELDMSYAFRAGVAAGSASAFSDKLAVKEQVMELLNKVR